MAKLTLAQEPTFKAPVAIPVPGSKPVSVSFTFKWRTRDEARAWLEEVDALGDEDVVLSMASGWELDDTFDADNVKALCQKFAGAASAIFSTYVEQLRGAKAKN